MKYYLPLFFFFYSISFFAQDISGLWVAKRIDQQTQDFYAIMYIKTDGKGNVVGYTYDEEAGGWCNYKIEGNYKKNKKQLKVANTDLIEKTENHKGSKYNLNYLTKDNEEFLEGFLKLKGTGGVLGAITSIAIGVGVGVATGGRVIIAGNFGRPVPKRYVIYSRPKEEDLDQIEDYDKLKPYIDALEGRDPEENEPEEDPIEEDPEEEVVVEETPEEPIDEKPEDEVVVETPEEPVEEDPIEAVEETDETIALTKEKEERKDELLKSHTIKYRKLTIEIVDKNLEDGDRISIYVNDTLFKFDIEVKREPQFFEVTLPANQSISRVTFVANNVGRVPPNTATVRYKVDGTTYEEALSTDEDENKYLEFKLE